MRFLISILLFISFKAQSASEDCFRREEPLTSLQRLQNRICESNPEFCGKLQPASVVGEESAHIVSNDPNTEEAQIAESNGPVVFCGRKVGSMTLYRVNGKLYFIGAAHSFYEGGTNNLKCSDEEAKVFLDYHYKGNPDIDPSKHYTIKMPPLNHESDFSDFNNDIAIFEVPEESDVLRNQTGGERPVLSLSQASDEELVRYSRSQDTLFISSRNNFGDGRQTTLERGRDFFSVGWREQFKHTFDTGGGSSGASIISHERGQLVGLGIHVKTRGSDEGIPQEIALNPKHRDGNWFIPASKVWDEFEKSGVMRPEPKDERVSI